MELHIGALKDWEDPRDFSVSTIRRELKETDLSSYVLYVRNQKYNDCVINTFNGLFEIEYQKKFGKNLIYKKTKGLSNGFGYTIARQHMKTFPHNTGLYPREVVKQYNKEGICPEYFLPYDKYELTTIPEFKPMFASNFFKVRRYEAVTPDQLPYVISANKPVAIAMNLDGNFLGYNGRGILKESDGKNYGGHAMVGVGVYFDSNNNIIIKVLNSWGKYLGRKGYWHMTLDYLQNQSGSRRFWAIDI